MSYLLLKNVPQKASSSLVNGWDPFQVVDSLLNWGPVPAVEKRRAKPAFTPRFDVKETGTSYLFKADLPGVKESDVDISLDGNRLTVSGKREVEEKQEGDSFFLSERSYGTFARSFALPENADVQNVTAQLKDGVLTISLAKRAEAQPRKITLNTAAAQAPAQTPAVKA